MSNGEPEAKKAWVCWSSIWWVSGLEKMGWNCRDSFSGFSMKKDWVEYVYVYTSCGVFAC